MPLTTIKPYILAFVFTGNNNSNFKYENITTRLYHRPLGFGFLLTYSYFKISPINIIQITLNFPINLVL